jgi:hypothetical protein
MAHSKKAHPRQKSERVPTTAQDQTWTAAIASKVVMPLLVAWKCIEHLHTVDYVLRLHPRHFVISSWHFIESPHGHTLLLLVILACIAAMTARPGR